MPDASPANLALGTGPTWFFEIPWRWAPFLADYRWTRYDLTFNFLFNSYYDLMAFANRGRNVAVITRPEFRSGASSLSREYCPRRPWPLEGDAQRAAREVIELGCHHEQQHQELLLTDTSHTLIFPKPSVPSLRERATTRCTSLMVLTLSNLKRSPAALAKFGDDENRICLRCRGASAQLFYLEPFRLADRSGYVGKQIDGVHCRWRLPQSAALALRRLGEGSVREKLDHGATLLGKRVRTANIGR